MRKQFAAGPISAGRMMQFPQQRCRASISLSTDSFKTLPSLEAEKTLTVSDEFQTLAICSDPTFTRSKASNNFMGHSQVQSINRAPKLQFLATVLGLRKLYSVVTPKGALNF